MLNHPTNPDARASAVLCICQWARAGCWERYAPPDALGRRMPLASIDPINVADVVQNRELDYDWRIFFIMKNSMLPVVTPPLAAP